MIRRSLLYRAGSQAAAPPGRPVGLGEPRDNRLRAVHQRGQARDREIRCPGKRDSQRFSGTGDRR